MTRTLVPTYWLLSGTSRFLVMKQDRGITTVAYVLHSLDKALRVVEDCNATAHLESVEYAIGG